MDSELMMSATNMARGSEVNFSCEGINVVILNWPKLGNEFNLICELNGGACS